MKLGTVLATHDNSGRITLDVQVDEERLRDVALVHPLHVRSRVLKGDRVLVGQIDGNDTLLLAWPVEFATQVADVVLRRADGVMVALRGVRAEVIAPEVRLGENVEALTGLTNGVVLARGIDTFSGATYGALGSASSKVLAE